MSLIAGVLVLWIADAAPFSESAFAADMIPGIVIGELTVVTACILLGHRRVAVLAS